MATSSNSDNAILTQSTHPTDSHQILQHDTHTLVRTPRKVSASSASSGEAAMKISRASPNPNRPSAYSSSSRNTHTSVSTRQENGAAQRVVKSIPPWVASYEDDDDIPISRATDRLLSTPPRAHAAQHHYTPTESNRRTSQDGYVEAPDEDSHGGNSKKPETGFFGGHKEPVKGRKWDHARDADPVIVQSGDVPVRSPWVPFIKSSMYAPAQDEDRRLVTPEFLQQQTPGYAKPWRGDLEVGEENEKFSALFRSKKKRKTIFKRLQHILLMHPLVPLVFRVTVLITSIVALSIAASIHHLSNKYTYSQNASATMAIVVDVVAIPYILYITWDEYTGKPLGLRSPKAKIRLVLLDLFFIIFESANLALAFGALTLKDGSCTNAPGSPRNFVVCHRVEALCAILMVALFAWGLTFSVSIFRLVERVGGREDGD